MRFTVEIEIGNEAMSSGMDVADALRKVAYKVEDEVGETDVREGFAGADMPVVDEDGNTVGRAGFEIEKE